MGFGYLLGLLFIRCLRRYDREIKVKHIYRNTMDQISCHDHSHQYIRDATSSRTFMMNLKLPITIIFRNIHVYNITLFNKYCFQIFCLKSLHQVKFTEDKINLCVKLIHWAYTVWNMKMFCGSSRSVKLMQSYHEISDWVWIYREWV